MNGVYVNATIIEGYLRLLDTLSPSSKLDLIFRLSASVKDAGSRGFMFSGIEELFIQKQLLAEFTKDWV